MDQDLTSDDESNDKSDDKSNDDSENKSDDKSNDKFDKTSDQNNKGPISVQLIPAYSITYAKKKLVRILSKEIIIPKQ